VNALTNAEVGKYLNEHFVSSYLKLGTFRVANGKKQGGNVASYFTLSNGAVLHVIPGPVDAATLLREARWVVETRKLATTLANGDLDKYKEVFRKAHMDRLVSDSKAADGRTARSLSLQGRAHRLLLAQPLAPVDEIYEVVFQDILGEKVSTAPVVRR
jgi:hypothetical protein